MAAGCAAAGDSKAKRRRAVLPGFRTHLLISVTGDLDSFAEGAGAVLPGLGVIPVTLMRDDEIPGQLLLQIVESLQPARYQPLHLVAFPEAAAIDLHVNRRGM